MCRAARRCDDAAALRAAVGGAGDGFRRSASAGDAAHRHHFAVVVEGNRHCPQLRSGRRSAHRAWRAVRTGGRAKPARRRCGRGRTRRAGRRAARPHDRVGAEFARRRRRAVQPRGTASAGERVAGGRSRLARARQCRTGSGAVGRRDRLSAGRLHQAAARPDRRRTDDVRAGQFRALPSQDFQRQLEHRLRDAGHEPVRHDPRDPPRDAAAHRGCLFGQRGGDRGRHHGAGRPLLPGPRRPLGLAFRTDAFPGQGRNAQSPDRDFAFPRRRHRCRRRNPRRGRDRPWREAQGRSGRLLGVQPEHPRLRAAVGARRRRAVRQAGAHRLGAADHDRRPAGCGRLQQ